MRELGLDTRLALKVEHVSTSLCLNPIGQLCPKVASFLQSHQTVRYFYPARKPPSLPPAEDLSRSQITDYFYLSHSVKVSTANADSPHQRWTRQLLRGSALLSHPSTLKLVSLPLAWGASHRLAFGDASSLASTPTDK